MTVEDGRLLGATSELSATVHAHPRRTAAGAWREWLRAVYVIWLRDVIRYWRDRVRLLASLAQPLLFLLIFGVGLSSSLSGAGSGVLGGGSSTRTGVDYVVFMFPGVLGMAVLFTSIFSAMSIVWDREFGFLREILVAPISRSAVAVGKTLGGTTQAMVQGMIMLVFAPVVGLRLSLGSILALIPLFFVLAFALTSFGVALAARMRSMQGFQVVMNLLLMPMFFLSGALFPLDALPGWMTVLTRFDPVAYGIAPVRTVALEGSGVASDVVDRVGGVTIGGHTIPLLGDVAILLGFGALALGLAILSFRRRD
jgi:ABC-2 type transport system permease protein